MAPFSDTCVRRQGSETTIFPCERWLAKSEDDGETVRELVPSDIITEKLLRDGKLKQTETEVEDALESTSILILIEVEVTNQLQCLLRTCKRAV